LHFDRTARDVEELFFAAWCLYAHLARPQRRQQRCMPRRYADVTHRRRREDHRGFAGKDLAFGADDIDVDGCHELNRRSLRSVSLSVMT